MYYIILFTSR